MILSSRPLRFLGAVIGGWVGVRAAMLWPVAEIVPALARAVAPAAVAEDATAVIENAAPVLPRIVVAAALRRPPALAGSARARAAVTIERDRTPAGLAFGLAAMQTSPAPPAVTLPGIDPPPAFRASRWSGSAWAILRPGGRATPFASQLGGSQVGARLAYAVDAGRRVALYARASTAIDAAQREAAVGVDWRPTRLPVHLVAERRIGIEGIRGGMAVGAVGGVGPTRVAGPVRLEGYAQAGVIFRDGHEGFADGSVRFTLPVAKRVDLGVGAWGAAQRGATRVDLGPTLGLTLPIERHALRLSVDWRQRVAGEARPGSGPAVSLGVDF